MMRPDVRSWLVPLALALSLAGCAALAPSREITVSEAQLQELVARRYGGVRSFLAVFEVALSEPKITLEPATGRVRTAMQVSLGGPMMGSALKGSAVLSGRLAFDPATRAIVLREPKADSVSLEGVPERYAGTVSRIGGWLTEQVLREFPVYTLTEQDLRVGGIAYEPRELKVGPRALTLTLAPSSAR